MTYPEIGNYGTNALDHESSGRLQVEGFIVRELSVLAVELAGARKALPQYLREHRITRHQPRSIHGRLTRHHPFDEVR